MRIHSDPSHYHPTHRGQLADILRPFWKDPPISQAERRKLYGSPVDRYQIVNSLDDADVAVLPMSWNYYYKTKELDQALHYIKLAHASGKPVATWVTGDQGVRVPVPNVTVFRASGYRSRRHPHQQALPVFVRDPLVQWAGAFRRKSERPVVGFCGQAEAPKHQVVRILIQNLANNLDALRPRSWRERETLYPHIRLRAKCLAILESSPLIRDNFIKRNRYKAGARTPEATRQIQREFFENIRGSDYTLCVRGRGNFSARLYETMAAGRVPIIIDTDSLLPFHAELPWKRISVWVPVEELDQLPQRVTEFHARHDDDEFLALQSTCRRTWESYLSFSGFMSRFPTFFGMEPIVL